MIYFFNGQPGYNGDLVKRQVDFQQIPGNLDFAFDPAFLPANFPAVILRSRPVRLHICLEFPAAAEDSAFLLILTDTH